MTDAQSPLAVKIMNANPHAYEALVVEGIRPGLRWLILAVLAVVAPFLVVQSAQDFRWSERLGGGHETRGSLVVAFSICACMFVWGGIAWRIVRKRSGH